MLAFPPFPSPVGSLRCRWRKHFWCVFPLSHVSNDRRLAHEASETLAVRMIPKHDAIISASRRTSNYGRYIRHVVDRLETDVQCNGGIGGTFIRSTMNLVRIGASSRTAIRRTVCIAITKDTSTLLEAAMMATESAPPGLVAR
jgi:hypothetical protein